MDRDILRVLAAVVSGGGWGWGRAQFSCSGCCCPLLPQGLLLLLLPAAAGVWCHEVVFRWLGD